MSGDKGEGMPAAGAEGALERERFELLRRLDRWLEPWMIGLGFVWLGLLVAESVYGESRLFEVLSTAIWAVFVVDFAAKFVIAPRKLKFLRRNWLTVLALAVPALRVFRLARLARVLRFARVTRGARLVRVVGSVNRGMKALAASMGRRGFGYVAALTALVTFAGAAGMYAFEDEAPGGGLNSFGAALWWTAMIMTTMGSEYWPRTPEGRVLCFLLSLYAFAVFGYVTATLATFFVGRDAEDEKAELAGAKSVSALRAEVAASRADLAALRVEIAALAAEVRSLKG